MNYILSYLYFCQNNFRGSGIIVIEMANHACLLPATERSETTNTNATKRNSSSLVILVRLTLIVFSIAVKTPK